MLDLTSTLLIFFLPSFLQELYLYDSAGKELFSEVVQKYVSKSDVLHLKETILPFIHK